MIRKDVRFVRKLGRLISDQILTRENFARVRVNLCDEHAERVAREGQDVPGEAVTVRRREYVEARRTKRGRYLFLKLVEGRRVRVAVDGSVLRKLALRACDGRCGIERRHGRGGGTLPGGRGTQHT